LRILTLGRQKTRDEADEALSGSHAPVIDRNFGHRFYSARGGTRHVIINLMVLDLEANQVQIQRILQSKVFRTSEIHRNLLSYLAEKSLAGTADGLKEYTVGLDVFSKPPSYDPRQESVVRMHVARLRQKLSEFYRTEGADDPVFVDLPKGGFKVIFETRRIESALPPAPPPPRWRRSEQVLAACLAVTIVLVAFFGLRLRRLEHGQESANIGRPSAWTPDLQQLWAPILSSNRRLMVCLSAPLFIHVPGFGFVRESTSNNWSSDSDLQSISSLQEALHVSGAEPTYAFTGVGSATGAFLLGQFLAQRQKDVLLTRSDLISLPEIAMDNVVILGPAAGKQMEAIPENEQLVLEPEGIRNLKPRPGEPAFITERPPQGGEDVEESHALITLVPGLYGNGQILHFSGNQIPSVMAAVQAFTDPNLARTLVAKLKGASGTMPRSYQIVLKVRSMDDMPIQISYVFHKELSTLKQSASASKP
jgi:hypothetical protein